MKQYRLLFQIGGPIWTEASLCPSPNFDNGTGADASSLPLDGLIRHAHSRHILPSVPDALLA
jgi:hypothetical protein